MTEGLAGERPRAEAQHIFCSVFRWTEVQLPLLKQGAPTHGGGVNESPRDTRRPTVNVSRRDEKNPRRERHRRGYRGGREI